jgi:hypothetical protein
MWRIERKNPIERARVRSPGAKDEWMVYVRGGEDDLDVFGASAKEGVFAFGRAFTESMNS